MIATLPSTTLTLMIVDDEPAARRILKECCEQEPDVRVVGEFGDGRQALAAISESPPDILLLDVQMTPITGVALARALDPDSLPLIVFVTAYESFALDAFELSAVDYVIKPFNDSRVHQALARARRRHKVETLAQRQLALSDVLGKLERSAQAMSRSPARIIAESAGRMHVIDIDQIQIVQSDRNYVKLTVGAKTFTARSTLLRAEETLVTEPMLKMSRSCLVNLRHVREISRTARGDVIVLLAGGGTVTSSERFRDSVRQRLDQMHMSPR
jgi:two-component system LytT family response regulator